MLGKIIILLALAAVVRGSDDPVAPLKHYSEDNNIDVLQPRQTTINYRLPNDTKPESYDITLSTMVHTGNREFNGSVTIAIVAKQPTRTITLHALQMNILNVRVFTVGIPNIVNTDTEFDLDTRTDFLTIPLPIELVVNTYYYVIIDYTGLLRSDQAGFYMSIHQDPSGNPKYIATTQFEQTDARHAFPCYDEPGTRATYTLRITHHDSYRAVSNMPVQSIRELNDSMVTTTFVTTPPMQTYLLAFVVLDFDFVSNVDTKTAEEVLQDVFARPEYIARGDADFALKAGNDVLNEVVRSVGQPYKLPKIDQVAVPQFAAGAMENWGLVTYRENLLLYTRGVQPMSQEKTVATIIAHEYGHQFFGNWVSPVWWNYLWLNEGFATLFEYYSAHHAYPDYKIWDFFNTEIVHYVMDRDNTVNVRPMTYYVEQTSQLGGLFDFIAYDKSGAVLRMFMYAFGEETFLKGLNYYLEDMENKAATSSDLSRGIEKAVREDGTIPATVNVVDIIHSWSEQSGFPILHVSRDDNGVVTLTQERYLNVNGTAAEKNKMWWLPFNFAVPTNANFEDTAPDSWMSNTQRTVSMESGAFGKTWTTNDWMIFNKKQTSYYRVNYDDKLWDLIVKGLHNGNYNGVHYTSRAQLLEDSFKLARLHRLNYKIVFGLISSMHKELEYLPWAVFNNNFGNINLILGGSPDYDKFKDFVKEKIEPYYNVLGAANRPTDMLPHRQGRIIAMNYACRMGSQSCLTETTARLNTLLNSNTEVEIDIRSQLYCNGLRAADADLFLRVWDKMLITNNDQTLRNLMTTALGCSENPALLETLLNTTIDATVTSYVNGDRGRVINAAFGNTNIGLETTLKFVADNYQRIHEVYDGATPLSNVFSAMGARIVSQDQLNRYRSLGQLLVPTIVSTNNFNNGIAQAENNLMMADAMVDDIIEFIDDYIENGGGGDGGDGDGGATTITFSSLALAISVVAFMYV